MSRMTRESKNVFESSEKRREGTTIGTARTGDLGDSEKKKKKRETTETGTGEKDSSGRHRVDGRDFTRQRFTGHLRSEQ